MTDPRTGGLVAADRAAWTDDGAAAAGILFAADVFALARPRRVALARTILERHTLAELRAAVWWHVERGRPGAWLARCLADPVGIERTLSAAGWRLPLPDVRGLPDAATVVEVLLLRAGLFDRAPAERAALARRLVDLQRFSPDDVATFLCHHLQRGRSCAWIATKLRREPECVARARGEHAADVVVGPVQWIMRRRCEDIVAAVVATVVERSAVVLDGRERVASPASHDQQATAPRPGHAGTHVARGAAAARVPARRSSA